MDGVVAQRKCSSHGSSPENNAKLFKALRKSVLTSHPNSASMRGWRGALHPQRECYHMITQHIMIFNHVLKCFLVFKYYCRYYPSQQRLQFKK